MSHVGWRRLVCLTLLVGGWATVVAAIDWPQEIDAEEGTIVVYQPQPEELTGNTLTGRAAMSIELDGRDDPIFGAFWFESKIDTDRDSGVALIRDLRVTNVRWPDSTDAQEQRFTAVVESAMPTAAIKKALDAQACCHLKRAASMAKAYMAPTEIIHGIELNSPI